MQEPVLQLYDPNAPTKLHTDACKLGFGAILMQMDNNGHWHPVHYMSTKTSDTESKYDSYTLETLAVIKALVKFRIYLMHRTFTIVTDCAAL